MINLVGINSCYKNKDMSCPYKEEYNKKCEGLLKAGVISAFSYGLSLMYLKDTREGSIPVVCFSPDREGLLLGLQNMCDGCNTPNAITSIDLKLIQGGVSNEV